MAKHRNFLTLTLIILITLIIFLPDICKSADIEVYGTVTFYENKPVADAKLSFYPESGDTVTCYTDGEGNYSAVLRHDSSVNAQKPEEIGLLQNYPNPFNPSTTIEFILGKPSYISLDIFNITGQKIRTLADGFKNAGSHFYRWDGTDNKRKAVSAGIYIYTLRTDGVLKSRRMTLLDGHSSAVSSQTLKITTSAKLSEINYSVAIEKDGFETFVENNISLSGLSERKNFKLIPHDFFPIEKGNKWVFMQSDSDSFEYLTGRPSVKVESDSLIDGEKYFLIVQDWNKTLPDSMLIRREKDKIFRLLGDSEWMIYDFTSPVGSSWDFPLSITAEYDTVWVNVEKLDTSKINSNYPDRHAFFRFTVEKTNESWYEIYYLNWGPSILRCYEPGKGKWMVCLLENFKGLGNWITIDYDFPGIINHLHRIFDGL